MRREWTDAEEAQLVEWRRAGVKLVQCSIRLDRPLSSIKHKLERLGVIMDPFKRMKHRKGEMAKKVKAMLARGVGESEAAERLGVGKTAVIHARQRLGIPGPTPSEVSRRRGVTMAIFRRARSAS